MSVPQFSIEGEYKGGLLSATGSLGFVGGPEKVAENDENFKDDLQDGKSRLRVLRTESYVRKTKCPIRISGKLVTEYVSQRVVDYVDISTGEVIPADLAHKDGLAQEPYNFGELVLQRAEIIDSLRKEVQVFANFVLKFRNTAGGLACNLDTIVKWFAKLNGKRPSNERRKVKALEEAGIIEGERVLPPFQILDRKADRMQAVREDKRAELDFSIMLMLHGGPHSESSVTGLKRCAG